MTNRSLRTTLIALGVASAACAVNPPPRSPEIARTSCLVPTFAALAETKEAQEKGGVQIAVAPLLYEAVSAVETTTRDIQPSFGDRLTAPQGWQTMRFVERTTRPVLRVTPDRLRFRVRISNHLPRVFRGAGTVVQFNAAGKLVPLAPEGYAELGNVIVPPRSEAQVEIYGPPLEAVPDQATLGLFLYDVVTKTDAAGNVTEKQNFEWYFNYATQLREETGPVHRERLWVR